MEESGQDRIKKLRARIERPFDNSEVKWRLQRSGKKDNGFWAIAIAYIDARALMDRLDQQFGFNNWKDEYLITDKGVMCSLSLRIENEWVTKTDGGEYTKIEPFKGGISDSFKRAGVKWGFARYLYEIPIQFVNTSSKKERGCTEKGSTKDRQYFYWEKPNIETIMNKM